MMLSCDKATALIERKTVAGLSVMERFKLLFHKSMCSGCRNYEKQSVFIHKIFGWHIGGKEHGVHETDIAQLQSDIIKEIEKR